MNSTCNEGLETQYLLTFLAPGGPLLASPADLALCLVLTNPSTTTPVEMNIEPHNQTLLLQPGEINAQKCFDGSVAPNGSRKQMGNEGLLISAKHCDARGVVVHGSVRTGHPSVYTSASFTVLPVTSLGFEYMVVTHCETHHCLVGIVAQQTTNVTVELKLHPYNATLVYNGVAFFHGGVIKEHLKRLQVMQILCEVCDMSGSRVTSTFPVAVLSGGEFTTVGGLHASDMDSVVEYIPPTDTLGTRYVIAKDTKAAYTIKVVPAHKDMVFFVSALNKCYAAKTAESNSWTLPLLEESKSAILNSTHPVLVSLLITYEVDEPSAARMTVLRPMSRWRTSYQVVQTLSTENNHLYIVGHFSNFEQQCLQYGGSNVTVTCKGPTMSTVEGSSTLRVTRVPLSNNISHRELTCSPACVKCEPFWGYVDGMDKKRDRGWAVPLEIFTSPPEKHHDCSRSVHLLSKTYITTTTIPDLYTPGKNITANPSSRHYIPI
ncbi:hypothetical protein ACOMHN_024894 [Nucella lapillus]